MQLRVFPFVFVLIQTLWVHEHAGQAFIFALVWHAMAHEAAWYGESLLQVRAVVFCQRALRPRLGSDFLACFVEYFLVSLELEEEVGCVDDEKDDRRSTGELGDILLRGCAVVVKDGRDNDGGDGEGEQRSGGLGDCGIEELLGATETAKEETKAHDEKQIGEDRSNQRGLYNFHFVIGKSDNGNDELNSVAKCGIEQSAKSFTGAQSDFFGCETQHGGQRDNGDKVHNKDCDLIYARVVERNANWRGDDEEVNPRVEKRPLKLISNGKGHFGFHMAKQPFLLGLILAIILFAVAICFGLG